MARPAAEAKLCFYPAHPLAIELLAKHLRLAPANPDRKHDSFNIIDPCAGEGLALKQLRDALGFEAKYTYAVELDAGRSAKIAEIMPGINLLGPASFIGSQITGFSFGLAYVNPPFSDELGGGKREEQAFAERAARLLAIRGVLVLVVPLKALLGNRPFVEFLDSEFEEVAVYKFPDGEDARRQPIRPFNEIVVIGRKRKQALPGDALNEHGSLHRMYLQYRGYIDMQALPALGQSQPIAWLSGRPSYEREPMIRMWEVPGAWKPNVFKKTALTDEELDAAIAASPLNRFFKEVAIPPPKSPPLPLDKGHLGLILASGMLDGVVEGPHGVHVVRGGSHKVEYHNKEASESTENPDTGAVTTKDVYSQRMVTTIRVVEQDGVIQTFSNEPKKAEEVDDEEVDDRQQQQERKYA